MKTELDTLYEKVGGWATCQRLSELFHAQIADDPVLKKVFPENLTRATERLALFLAERLGGPSDYTKLRGKNSLLCRHAHVPIGTEEVEAWLRRMDAAIDQAGLPESAQKLLRDYFSETAPTVSDPFLPLYSLPLSELQARLELNPALATACEMGRSLLREAAGNWDLPRVRMLLEYGSDVHVKLRFDHDALYYAANASAPPREAEGCAVVALLIKHGANVNGRSGVGQMTPLHMAARRGTVAIAEVLLSSGAEIEAKDSKGETPLRRAVNCGQEGMVRLLLSHGADPLTQDKQGRMALAAARHEPIRKALQEAVELLHPSTY